jgi:glutamate-1-semialdehyde 2,1-aminomutase
VVKAGVAAQVNSIGSLATLFFAAQPVRNYSDAKKSDTKRYGEFFRNMLDHGIFLAPSQYEAAFVSAAHTDADIDRTLAAARESLTKN